MNFTISVQRRTSSARELMAVPSSSLQDSHLFHISFRAAVVPVSKYSLEMSPTAKELKEQNKPSFFKLNTSRDVIARCMSGKKQTILDPSHGHGG